MDQKLFKIINSLAGKNKKVEQFMIFASGKFRYSFVFILFVSLRKKIVSQSIISVMINTGIKTLINNVKVRPRPFLKGDANVYFPIKHDSTYVSKHTLLSFAVSTTVFMYYKVLGVLMLLMSFLVGLSRIWVGVHYPFDVLRSLLIGSMVSFFVKKSFTL